jgi:hypothetical protein
MMTFPPILVIQKRQRELLEIYKDRKRATIGRIISALVSQYDIIKSKNLRGVYAGKS